MKRKQIFCSLQKIIISLLSAEVESKSLTYLVDVEMSHLKGYICDFDLYKYFKKFVSLRPSLVYEGHTRELACGTVLF